MVELLACVHAASFRRSGNATNNNTNKMDGRGGKTFTRKTCFCRQSAYAGAAPEAAIATAIFAKNSTPAERYKR
jgi:hypothetical protein